MFIYFHHVVHVVIFIQWTHQWWHTSPVLVLQETGDPKDSVSPAPPSHHSWHLILIYLDEFSQVQFRQPQVVTVIWSRFKISFTIGLSMSLSTFLIFIFLEQIWNWYYLKHLELHCQLRDVESNCDFLPQSWMHYLPSSNISGMLAKSRVAKATAMHFPNVSHMFISFRPGWFMKDLHVFFFKWCFDMFWFLMVLIIWMTLVLCSQLLLSLLHVSSLSGRVIISIDQAKTNVGQAAQFTAARGGVLPKQRRYSQRPRNAAEQKHGTQRWSDEDACGCPNLFDFLFWSRCSNNVLYLANIRNKQVASIHSSPRWTRCSLGTTLKSKMLRCNTVSHGACARNSLVAVLGYNLDLETGATKGSQGAWLRICHDSQTAAFHDASSQRHSKTTRVKPNVSKSNVCCWTPSDFPSKRFQRRILKFIKLHLDLLLFREQHVEWAKHPKKSKTIPFVCWNMFEPGA